ncbi:MAG: hypothetical protein ACYSTG_00115 [Planctomycetota bacterium]
MLAQQLRSLLSNAALRAKQTEDTIRGYHGRRRLTQGVEERTVEKAGT